MTKQNQVILRNYDSENYGKFLGQTVTNITIYKDYVHGYWSGKLVGAFSLKNGTWYVL